MDATEFCEAVKSLLYNLIGEHAARAGEVQARFNGGGGGAAASGLYGDVEGKDDEDGINQLMMEICEGIITHDR